MSLTSSTSSQNRTIDLVALAMATFSFGAFSGPRRLDSSTHTAHVSRLDSAEARDFRPDFQSVDTSLSCSDNRAERLPAGFGAPATSAAPAAGTTPSLFGSTTTPAASTAAPLGGLFGSAPATSGAGGGLFGSTTSQAPATGGGLFGSATPATGSAAPPTGGLFGSTNAGTTGGLFGAKPATTGATGGLFGSTTQQQQQPAAGGGLFGSTTAPATGGLFGSTAQQQPQQPQQQQAPSLFGQSQSAASASLFGPKPAGSSSLFGSSNPLLGSSTTAQPTAPSAPIPKLGDPLPVNPNEPSIESRLSALKDAWDPSSPKCRFQTYFYNEVPAGQSVGMYSRPVEGARRDEWERARRENPEPEK